MKRYILASLLVVCVQALWAFGQEASFGDLSVLGPGKSGCENALWHENAPEKQFTTTRRVVVADIAGPGEITMIHFALPGRATKKDYTLGRDLLLRIFWDGQEAASVDCPLVDFFCDPAGKRGVVNTAMVNKNRGFNAYFPMPFARHARVELVYEGAMEPGRELAQMMPCYSYVLYRKLEKPPENAGYFHAYWRQERLLLGLHDYVAMEAAGPGKFIGWNVTVRSLSAAPNGRETYPVDENEKFYVDGEAEASVELQGLEDAFGFSWGFPRDDKRAFQESFFPLTGFFPFDNGAAAYRFFVNDSIRFEKSLRVTIGFGKNESPYFRERYSAAGNELEFSSVCYWYQSHPTAAGPALPPADKRGPSPVVLIPVVPAGTAK